MVNLVKEDFHIDDGEPEEIFIELPEKKLLLPNPREAGSVYRISSPTPYKARLVAWENPILKNTIKKILIFIFYTSNPILDFLYHYYDQNTIEYENNYMISLLTLNKFPCNYLMNYI